MKTFSKAAACTLFLCMTLTACDNFMNGSDVKNEIISAIDYNNAKSISILVQPEPGTGSSVPSGNYSAKQGYGFELSFSETPGWSFEKWIAVTNDKNKTPVTKGVYFEDPESLKTKAIIQNDTDSILIIPSCKARIAVDGDPSPKYETLGVSRDYPIVVTFNQRLDSSSFIFSQDEIPQGAQIKKDAQGKIWAYTVDEQTFFKNISITNADGFSMADYYEQPKIDDKTGMILTINPDSNKLIPFNSNEILKTIIVTLSENIQNEEHIIMGASKTWRYLINDSTIEKASINISCASKEGIVSNEGIHDYSIGQTINLVFTEDIAYQFVKWDYDETNIYLATSDDPKSATAVVLQKPQDGETYIKAVCVERPRVKKFSPDTTGTIPSVGKNSSIEITFNHDLPATPEYLQTLEGISITIGGTPVKSSFHDPRIDGAKIIFDADPDNILEVAEDQKKTVSVNIPGDFYYLLEDGTKVTYGGNGTTCSYKIDYTTVEKAYASVSANNAEGTLENEFSNAAFSMNQTISISITVKEGFRFERWSASSIFLPEGENIEDYIKFENVNNPNTTITFLKPLEGIKIVAVCPALPSFTFDLTGSNGKFSPAKGELECVETISSSISFDPDRDYEFIKWEIYDSVTNDVYENGKYLTIAEPYKETTTYSFAAEPNTNVKLAVRPVIAERPQIISNSPTGSGVFRDSSIQILFDTDMDPASIYFSTDEMRALEAENVTQFLPPNAPEGTKIYGYIKDGETYFKNIMIRNKNTQKNINNCFVQPFFENASTLSIAAYKKPQNNQQGQNQQEEIDPYHKVLDDYTQILVCIEKGFYYTAENDKHVEMAGSKKWLYQVGSGDDAIPMVIPGSSPFEVKYTDNSSDLPTSYTAATTPSEIQALKKIGDNKFRLKLHVEEPETGSGPSEFFTVNLKRIYNEKYKTVTEDSVPYPVYYQTIKSGAAEFDSVVDMTGWKLKDGVYAMNFTFNDRSNNSYIYPEVPVNGEGDKYYFVLNNKGPEIDFPRNEHSLPENEPQIDLKWTKTSLTDDLVSAKVEYKKKNDENWSAPQELDFSGQYPSLSYTHLDFSTEYDFRVTYTDYDSKETVLQKTFITQPSQPLNLRVKSYTYNSVTWEWDPPEGLPVAGYNLFVQFRSATGSGGSGVLQNITDTSYTIPNLATLEFTGARVCAYNEGGIGPYNTSMVYTRTGPIPRNIISCYTDSGFDYVEIKLSEPDYRDFDVLEFFISESEEGLDEEVLKTSTPKYTKTLGEVAYLEEFYFPRTDFVKGKTYYVRTRTRLYYGGQTLYGYSNIKAFVCR